MLSYPNNAERHHNPDINRLVAAANEAGANLKVLILLRDGADLITSVGKRFGLEFRQQWGGRLQNASGHSGDASAGDSAETTDQSASKRLGYGVRQL